MGSLQNRQNIQEYIHSGKTFKFTAIESKKISLTTQDNKFDNSRQFEIQMKLQLRRRFVATGSSRRVEEGVNEVISLPTALL
jgi:hypothetical protein